ncbi:hypothetical protein [Hirschia litorea]|uniref:Uncharacterized protein n=1 Tax=Hirschia litorea TaxID=1199156 RepID=A0ABW2IML8_9PROT
MKLNEEYERPNTVAGLKAKRDELGALREKFRTEIKKITVDIDHIDASIRLFDPEADNYKIRPYVVKHRAEKGSVKRFVLNSLRTSETSLTSRQITELWAADRGLDADEATLITIRKRTSACINTCVKQGLVRQDGMTTDHDAYGPYKRWRIAK